MKTFRELIAWELEQERRKKRSLRDGEMTGKLSQSVLRKFRFLSSNVASADRDFPQNFGTA